VFITIFAKFLISSFLTTRNPRVYHFMGASRCVPAIHRSAIDFSAPRHLPHLRTLLSTQARHAPLSGTVVVVVVAAAAAVVVAVAAVVVVVVIVVVVVVVVAVVVGAVVVVAVVVVVVVVVVFPAAAVVVVVVAVVVVAVVLLMFNNIIGLFCFFPRIQHRRLSHPLVLQRARTGGSQHRPAFLHPVWHAARHHSQSS
jgi:hypothetical protein